jgi:hypothetical protein
MNKLNRLFLAVLLFVAAPLALACDYPQKPDVPAGGTASKDQMIAASRAVKTYQTDMVTYRECIDAESNDKVAAALESAEEAEVENLKAALNKKYNASVEEEELIVARFNEAVRDYKAKGQ